MSQTGVALSVSEYALDNAIIRQFVQFHHEANKSIQRKELDLISITRKKLCYLPTKTKTRSETYVVMKQRNQI